MSMTFSCVCFSHCVCVCVQPQSSSPSSVYFISYSLEFRFALLQKGRNKKYATDQKNGSHIGGNALTTGNFFVLLYSFPLPIQPSGAASAPPLLPLSTTLLFSLVSYRSHSQLASENTRAHTHARSIFRCWQFRRLLWQHVTGMRNNAAITTSQQLPGKSYAKNLSRLLCALSKCEEIICPRTERYFHSDSDCDCDCDFDSIFTPRCHGPLITLKSVSK